MSARYIWLSEDIATIDALMAETRQNELVVQQFKDNINYIENCDIIIKEIQSCYENNNLSNISMKNMIEDKREHAFWSSVLFFIFSAFFGVTAIYLQNRK